MQTDIYARKDRQRQRQPQTDKIDGAIETHRLCISWLKVRCQHTGTKLMLEIYDQLITFHNAML